jgi:hypothetical protein
LSKTDKLFTGPDAANTIVISTIGQMKSKHGPHALYNWRIAQGISGKEALALWNTPDAEWEHDLRGCFDIEIMDEAHLIKNESTNTHTTMSGSKQTSS